MLETRLLFKDSQETFRGCLEDKDKDKDKD